MPERRNDKSDGTALQRLLRKIRQLLLSLQTRMGWCMDGLDRDRGRRENDEKRMAIVVVVMGLMLAPGGGLTRLNVSVLAGTSLSVALAVNVSVAPSLTIAASSKNITMGCQEN